MNFLRVLHFRDFLAPTDSAIPRRNRAYSVSADTAGVDLSHRLGNWIVLRPHHSYVLTETFQYLTGLPSFPRSTNPYGDFLLNAPTHLR